MAKVRITQKEAALLKERGYLVVDEEFAGNTPNATPVRKRADLG